MGFDVAGIVVETGTDVNQFKTGDAVFAMAPYSNFGTFAEFAAIDEQFVAMKPSNVTSDEAARDTHELPGTAWPRQPQGGRERARFGRIDSYDYGSHSIGACHGSSRARHGQGLPRLLLAQSLGAEKEVLKKDTGRSVTINPMVQPRPAKFGAKCVGEIMVHASGAQLKELSRLMEAGVLKPVIDSVFSFEELLPALEKLKSPGLCGKVVLRAAS
ncbi:hypothetical protein PHYBOEH_000982 [Phytophthora boehmeriae]|uniref:Alcohol dehydrogenase-like N-terminal domain-containing protein n=1 Tax=Phytophthora boehmeriae TaxID=109152 RepID=A0A8T1VAE2_9STRA|nr:hypothetical protein PHYBOEH_000982 [Phytophthora boehmeriae]